MGEVLTNRLCPHCSVLYRKNRDNSGDYDEEGKLLAYCPQCGEMHPPLVVNEITFNISVRQRHNMGTRIAKRNGAEYKIMHTITNSLKYTSDNTFVKLFVAQIFEVFDITLRKEDVINELQGSGKIGKGE